MRARLLLLVALLVSLGMSLSAIDATKNFIRVTVSTGYNNSATSIVLTAGGGALLPSPPFNVVWYDATNYPDPSNDPNVEIVRVTAIVTDTLTVTRAQEGTTGTSKNTGGATYKMIQTPTALTFTQINTGLSGAVTHSVGALTATDIVIGNGSGDTKVSGCTIDSSNNLSCPGTITGGTGSGAAGNVVLSQGTFPSSFAANTFGLVAPTSITSAYQWVVPGADANGFLLSSGAGTPGVLSIVGFSGTGNVARVASPTFTGTVTAAAATLSSTLTTNVTGSTQCLHANSSGVVSGTGSDCGAGGGGGTVYPQAPGLRLTLETGVPISTTDQLAKGTLYYTPYLSGHLDVYSGAAWVTFSQAEISLSLTATSGKNYDVFACYGSGTPALALSAAWTNDTTRADALALQDGMPVKSADHTCLHVGMIRASGTNQTADSGGGGTSEVGGTRFVWNRYNQVRRSLAVIDTTDSWTYGSSTPHQANAAAGNKVEYVCGLAGASVEARVLGNATAVISVTSPQAGIGVDATTAFSGLAGEAGNGSVTVGIASFYEGPTPLGYHYIAWLEATVGGTATFFGDAGLANFQSGLYVSIQN